MIRFKTKFSICIFGSLLMALPGYARQISFEEAIKNVSGNLATGYSRSTPSLLYTESAGNLNVAYIVAANKGDGYMVLAADDVLPAILGYSDTGQFDPASIPPAMTAWMQEYGRQLIYSVENGYNTANTSRVANHQSIAPLCKATWGQSTPFNNNCPDVDKKHSPAGCTATAMAQVTYAHKWPETGTGENSYISGTFRQKLTFNFGTATFDWDNMLPSYASGYTPQQAEAVATLMEACGNAALMDYGISTSGAYPYNAIYGMVKYMKYDKSALMLMRDYYTSAQWDELVYNELANGRPVIYGGYTADYTSGHTFVVDGYDKDGYYHLNWGWSGLSNGYFLLTALYPADQGIGGSSSGYNYNQDAIINIMPAKDDSKYRIEVMWDGDFTTTKDSYPRTSSSVIEFKVGSDGNFSAFTLEESAKVTMGVKLTPADGGEAVFYPGPETEFNSYYGESSHKAYSGFSLSASSLPASGEYIATPAYQYNGEVKDVAVRSGMQRSLKISCARVAVAIEGISVSRTLKADNVKTLTPLYSGKTCNVSANINNTGDEYHGMVKAGFANSEGTVLTWLGNVPVSIPDGESISANFTGTLVRMSDNQPLATGDYTLSIYDEAGNQISTPVSVTVTDAPTGKPVYTMNIKVTGASGGDGTGVNPYIVGDQIKAEITVSVTSGLFDEDMELYAYYESNNKEADFSGENRSKKIYFVGPGMSQSNTYVIGTANFEPDKTVYIQPYGWTSKDWFPQMIYVKRTSSGIEEVKDVNTGIYPNPAVSSTTVTANAVITAIDVYSINGSRVMSIGNCGTQTAELNVSALHPGHYIVTVKTANGIERYRLIKK